MVNIFVTPLKSKQKGHGYKNADSKQNHYAIWKWIVVVAAAIMDIVMAVFFYLSLQMANEISNHIGGEDNQDYHWYYLYIVISLDAVNCLGYIACLILVCQAMKLLRTMLNDLIDSSLNTCAAVKHLSVILFMLISFLIQGLINLATLIQHAKGEEKLANLSSKVISSELCSQIGEAIAFIILLHMIWEYTKLQELCFDVKAIKDQNQAKAERA